MNASPVDALPFIGVLFSFAVLPGLLPRLWHRRMGTIILLWVAFYAGQSVVLAGPAMAVAGLWQAILVDYVPFMAILLALYALGGGILVAGGPWGRPAGNVLLLVIGTLLAGIMGTIGASLLLIHPLLASNAQRFEKRHLVVAFIILVANAGGALSPLGDPPLLVGFLRGVPFFWPLTHLLVPMLMVAVPVLVLCYAIDRHLARREAPPLAQTLRLRGTLNMLLLLLLTGAITLEGFWHPGNIRLAGAAIPGEQAVATLVAGFCILLSELFTPRAIRQHNRFAWSAMREIIILFFAIFVTIAPVLSLLHQVDLREAHPALWFWLAGICSALLDSAPTYLMFFEAAGGHAASLVAPPSRLLSAIASGAVFFGAATYLGNAPNLMIRAIAARRGVKMPGFALYSAIACAILLPIFTIMSVTIFR